MFRKIIPLPPPTPLGDIELPPVDLEEAYKLYMRSRHVVGYCTIRSVALLSRLNPVGRFARPYGFVYLNASRLGPVFVNRSAKDSLRDALTRANNEQPLKRVMIVSQNIFEFAEAARRIQNAWDRGKA